MTPRENQVNKQVINFFNYDRYVYQKKKLIFRDVEGKIFGSSNNTLIVYQYDYLVMEKLLSSDREKKLVPIIIQLLQEKKEEFSYFL